MKQTDRNWELYGRTDPYYGVLTDPKYKKGALDSAKLEEFFQTGERYIETLFARVRQHLTASFSPTKALDFGCGVGRLTLPLARRCQCVHGVDVSPSMLVEARANAVKNSLNNLEFFESDDTLSKIGGNYDLINSYIVLQHIPTERGMRIVQQLLSRLAPGGVVALHIPYYTDRSRIRSAISKLRRYVPLANYAANLVEGNSLRYPHIEMNVYPLGEVCQMMQARGVQEVMVQFEQQPLYLSAALLGRKA